MVSQRLKIINPQGVHMRPANEFVREMMKYDAEVTLVTDKGRMNGKSIMNVIASGLCWHSDVEIVCEGREEKRMLNAATELINSGFGEL